jgi:hypothetical protein
VTVPAPATFKLDWLQALVSLIGIGFIILMLYQQQAGNREMMNRHLEILNSSMTERRMNEARISEWQIRIMDLVNHEIQLTTDNRDLLQKVLKKMGTPQ